MNTQLHQHTTGEAVAVAVGFTADKYFSGDRQAVTNSIRHGNCEVCWYLRNALVTEIVKMLQRFQLEMNTVYRIETGTSDSSNHLANTKQKYEWPGIHLVICTEQKTDREEMILESLEKQLEQDCQEYVCRNSGKSCCVVDLQCIDNHMIEESRGLGLVVQNDLIKVKREWAKDQIAQYSETRSKSQDSGEVKGLSDLFDPNHTPINVLFERASLIQRLPSNKRVVYEPHFHEIKVVLIRRLISDQLEYINVAKNWLSLEDLLAIHQRKIGLGRIGGKAAGMLLAHRILNRKAEDTIKYRLAMPESWYIGSDVSYIFMAMNGLMHWNDEKYKSEEEIWADYQHIQAEFQEGELPPEVVDELKEILERVGSKPLIVRSSSQLEDNFGAAFAGKYESHFLGNQGSKEENLKALCKAVVQIYASTLKPEALLYRRRRGLQDYDERMAVLIQEVQGETVGQYYYPYGAGVAFSRNLYRWAPQIRQEDGFMRLVWGLGTRAVERVGDDFPRLVALSHPQLQPDDTPEAVRYYSQRYVDVIDLEGNQRVTKEVWDVMKRGYKGLRWMVEEEQDGYFTPLRGRYMGEDMRRLAVTYGELLKRTQFAGDMKVILKTLEEAYGRAVDVEFTIGLEENGGKAEVKTTLLQCRPQSEMKKRKMKEGPVSMKEEDVVMKSAFMVPEGYVGGIEYVVYVPWRGYFGLGEANKRREVGRVIGKLNEKMKEKAYICVGPGRWGTMNLDLGVYVSYGDVDRAGALVEVCGKGTGVAPEPSLGTHFFQDLMEGEIYPVALNLSEEGNWLSEEFFDGSENRLREWVEGVDEKIESSLKLIRVKDMRADSHLEFLMDINGNKAVGFLEKD